MTDWTKGLSRPAIRALEAAGIHDLDAIENRSETTLLALHGVGPKAIPVLRQALAARGKRLKDETVAL